MVYEYDKRFWDEIGAEIKDSIPESIKIVLSMCGFDSRLSLCNISDDDVSTLEQFASENMKDQLKPLLKSLPGYNRTKATSRDEPFKFLPGHRRIIIEIGKILANSREIERVIVTSQRRQTKKQRVPVTGDTATDLKEQLCLKISKWARNKRKNIHDEVIIVSLLYKE